MKVRNKKTQAQGQSTNFNVHSLSEIVVAFEDGTMDSDYIRNYDVWINDTWVDMSDAFKRNLLISDNYNTIFFEPTNEEDKIRGYTL